MKKKLQKYLSGEREGFSLIELIIVIAIMAILIGVIALAVIPYLEKSRVGKDQQTVDTVYSAFQATIADQKISDGITVTIPNGGTATSNPANANFLTSMAEALNATGADDMHSGTSDKLVSKDATGQSIVCTFTASSGEIKAEVVKGDKVIVKSSNKK